MDDEWISAADAYRLVARVAGLAGDTICSRAFDGMVRARAKRLVWGQELEDNCDIPALFWWARGEAALTMNWTTGDFETWIEDELHCRAYGVEFLRLDIEAIIPKGARGSTEKPEGSSQSGEPTGRRPSDRWRPWIAELVAYVHHNGIPPGIGSQGQEELIQAIADALAVRGEGTLARATVQPVVQAVLDRLRAAEN